MWVAGASAALLSCGACSSKDDRAPGARNESGGAAQGGGSGGTNGSGARPSGGNGASTGGTSGGAGPGGGSGGSDNGTGGVAPSCTPSSAADAGLTWRDFRDDTCKACPATALTECEQFTAAPGPAYDAGSKVLTLHVEPGLTEVVGLRLEGRTSVAGSDEFTFVVAAATIAKDTVSFDFDGKLPDGAQGFFDGLLVGDDACGGPVDTSASLKFEIRFDAAGAVDRIGCVE